MTEPYDVYPLGLAGRDLDARIAELVVEVRRLEALVGTLEASHEEAQELLREAYLRIADMEFK